MDNQNVVIVIPTHNEADVIATTIEQVFQSTASIANKQIHILIFDSASTDATQQIVKALQQTHSRLHLVTEEQKNGLGMAYLQAMRHALEHLNADVVVEFDADLSHQPHYIEPMLTHLDLHDVVIGSRYVVGGSIPAEWHWYRKVLSKAGNHVARIVLTRKYKDWTSGFRATRRTVLMSALPYQFLSRHYAYKIHLFWILHKNNAKIYEYPIEFVDRQHGVSKLPSNSLFDSLVVVLRLRLSEWTKKIKMFCQ